MTEELANVLSAMCDLMIDALRADAPDDKEHVIREIIDLTGVIAEMVPACQPEEEKSL